MPGPISLAVAVSAPVAGASAPPPAEGQEPDPNKPETRLVVVGDSDFAANSVAGIGGNRDMFLNIVNWLAQQDNLISVRPRNPEDRRHGSSRSWTPPCGGRREAARRPESRADARRDLA